MIPAALIYALSDEPQRAALNRARAERGALRERRQRSACATHAGAHLMSSAALRRRGGASGRPAPGLGSGSSRWCPGTS